MFKSIKMLYPFDLLLLLANNQQLLKFFSIRCIRNILPYSVKSSLKNSLLKLRIDNQNNIVLHIFVFSQGFANGLEDITVVMTNHIFNIFNENYPMFLPFNHTKQFKKQIPTIIIKSLAITRNTKGLAWETSHHHIHTLSWNLLRLHRMMSRLSKKVSG